MKLLLRLVAAKAFATTPGYPRRSGAIFLPGLEQLHQGLSRFSAIGPSGREAQSTDVCWLAAAYSSRNLCSQKARSLRQDLAVKPSETGLLGSVDPCTSIKWLSRPHSHSRKQRRIRRYQQAHCSIPENIHAENTASSDWTHVARGAESPQQSKCP